MTGSAIGLMLTAVVIIWGGLAVSVTALVSRGRREDRDARDAASAAAHEHLRDLDASASENTTGQRDRDGAGAERGD